MPVKDGPHCPGCGLPNYEGMCPHCRADIDAYEDELVPPFPSMRPDREDERAPNHSPEVQRFLTNTGLQPLFGVKRLELDQ